MATEGDSGKSTERQSEALSRSPQIQSKDPVRPPRNIKKGEPMDRAVSSQERRLLSGLIAKLDTEEANLRAEINNLRMKVVKEGADTTSGEGFSLVLGKPALWIALDGYRREQYRLRSAMKRGITPDLVAKYPELGSVAAKVRKQPKDMVLGTQQQPKDMANKSGILDGGGDDRGKSPVLEEQVPIADWKFKPEMEVDSVTHTNESPRDFSIVLNTDESPTDSIILNTDESPTLEPVLSCVPDIQSEDESSTLQPVLCCGPDIQSKVHVLPLPPHCRKQEDPVLPPKHLLQQQKQPSVHNHHEICPQGTNDDVATTLGAQFQNLDLSVSKLVELDRGESLSEEQVKFLETQQLPRDMANKLDILDGGGDETEVKMGRGKSLKEKQVMVLETQQQPTDVANKLDKLDGGANEPEVEMDRRKSLLREQVKDMANKSHISLSEERETWKQQQSILFSKLESCVQVLKEMMEAGRGAVNFYPEMQIEELSAVYHRTSEAIRNLHFLLKSIPNWVWDEVEGKQMAKAGMEVRAKPFMEKQVIGPLPRETDMEGGSRKQHQSQLLPCGLQIQSNDQSLGSKKGKHGGRKKGKHEGHKKGKYRVCAAAPSMDFEMEEESGKQQQLPRFLPHGSDIQSSDQHMIDLKVDKQKQMTEVEIDKQKPMTEVKMDKQKQTTKVEMDIRKQMAEVEMDDMDIGKSVQELTMEKEEIAAEEEDFACYKRAWESRRGPEGCGFFEDTTQLSSMHFTHLTPKPSLDDAIVAETLQILSIKLTEIKGGFKLPLSVYGVVAARDSVDNNCNLLFAHSRIAPQRIRQHVHIVSLLSFFWGYISSHVSLSFFSSLVDY
ncbi:hypothetical protein ACQJBY_018335 [Aegilops geniculata]